MAEGDPGTRDGWIKTRFYRDASVTPSKLSGGFLGVKTIEGGAAAAALVVTGIEVGDELVCVLRLNRDATAANIDISNVTSEFTITDADEITNQASGGTDTTGDTLIVFYLDLTE